MGLVSTETKDDLAWLASFVKGDDYESEHLASFQRRLKAGGWAVHDLRVFWDTSHVEHAQYLTRQDWRRGRLRAAAVRIPQAEKIPARQAEAELAIKQGPHATAALHKEWSKAPLATCITPAGPKTGGGGTTGSDLVFPSGARNTAPEDADKEVASNRQRSEAHGPCSASATKPAESPSGDGGSSWNGDESISGSAFHRKEPPSRYVPK